MWKILGLATLFVAATVAQIDDVYYSGDIGEFEPFIELVDVQDDPREFMLKAAQSDEVSYAFAETIDGSIFGIPRPRCPKNEVTYNLWDCYFKFRFPNRWINDTCDGRLSRCQPLRCYCRPGYKRNCEGLCVPESLCQCSQDLCDSKRCGEGAGYWTGNRDIWDCAPNCGVDSCWYLYSKVACKNLCAKGCKCRVDEGWWEYNGRCVRTQNCPNYRWWLTPVRP